MSEKVETTLDFQVTGGDKFKQELTDLRLNVHDLNLLMSQTVTLMRRLGVGENLVAAYSRIQQLIMSVNSLRIAIFALQAGAGPVGWLMLAVAGASMALTLQPGLGARETRNGLEVVRSR